MRAAILFRCIFSVTALKLSNIPDPTKELIKDSVSVETQMMGIIQPADEKKLEATGLREPTTKRLQSSKEQLTFFFVGDSIVRNQFQGLCLLLNHSVLNPSGSGTFTRSDDLCADSHISAHYMFMSHLNETSVSTLLQRSGRQPSAIYWNAAMHSIFRSEEAIHSFDNYPLRISKTAETYAKDAPDAKLVFFLSHATCIGLGKKKMLQQAGGDRTADPLREKIATLNKQAQTALDGKKDGQGRTVKLVDGFNLTKDPKMCDLTEDGRHWNMKVWEELNMFLDAIGL